MNNGKKYRFYFHYYKQKNKMSVHFKKQCIVVKNVNVEGLNLETKWYDIQPHLRVQGWCSDVVVENDVAYIK